MKKIILSGEIGWDVSPDKVRNQINEAKGDDIDVQISSPGGFVFDGLEIYNMFSEYRRENPKTQMLLTLKGLVASMASYIASNPAFDIVKAEDNAVFMIHNPYALSIGDYRDMQKSYDILSGLTKLLAGSYAARTQKASEDIQKLMDDETWYFGDEIMDNGFVDEMIKTGEDLDKSAACAKAKVRFQNLINRMEKTERTKDDVSKIAAMLKDQGHIINHIVSFIDPMGPYANEHSARITDPDQYDSFARADNSNDNFKDLPDGVSVILGIKDNKSEIQAYRFSIDYFTAAEAKKWLDDHDIKYISFEPATNSKSSVNDGGYNPADGGKIIKEKVMDKQQFQSDNPDLYAEILQAGAETERNRIQGIKSQLIPGHEALVQEMINDGKTTPEQAAIRIIKAENAKRQGSLDALKNDKKDVHAAVTPPVVPEIYDVDNNAPIEDRAKAEWDKSSELRDEFLNKFDVFLAFKKQFEAGNIKIKRGR